MTVYSEVDRQNNSESGASAFTEIDFATQEDGKLVFAIDRSPSAGTVGHRRRLSARILLDDGLTNRQPTRFPLELIVGETTSIRISTDVLAPNLLATNENFTTGYVFSGFLRTTAFQAVSEPSGSALAGLAFGALSFQPRPREAS